jgi:hypothetical protein
MEGQVASRANAGEGCLRHRQHADDCMVPVMGKPLAVRGFVKDRAVSQRRRGSVLETSGGRRTECGKARTSVSGC